MPGAWLILPTYNEAVNLEPFVRAVLPELAEAAPEHRILIVDDNSPDGTGRIADGLASELDAVEVLHRAEKQGLGVAYLAGFRRALDSGADLILEMDSDFSHSPADVPRLISAAEDADLVLGSRYVPGGGVSDWGVVRRLAEPRRILVRAGHPAREGGRPDGRLQVLPARGARGARPRLGPRRGVRIPDRADLPRAARPASA